MTALARRRKRRTIFAAVAAALLSIGAVAMLVVGVVTLSNSKEGEAVGIDERPMERFPATPNAVLGVTDDDGQLAAVVVMTLLPEGQGGSLVTFPVNADSTAGFGLQRRPLNVGFEADDIETLVVPVEEMLSISVQRATIVDPAGLAALIGPIESLEVIIPRDVVDSSTAEDDFGGNGLVVEAGPATLDQSEVVAALTAIDTGTDTDADADGEFDAGPDLGTESDPDTGSDTGSDGFHDVDVAIWTALSRSAPTSTPPVAVPLDDVGRPIAPDSTEELMDRMWQGDVGVREIALAALVAADNPTEIDVVLLDRRDSNLVFAQISPGLVSTPTTGMNVRVVAGFTSDQLAGSGYDSTTELLTEFIGKMLFVQASVISADSESIGAPTDTVIEVADETLMADSEQAAIALFGNAEVRLADTVIEGVDIVVTLGTSYLGRDSNLDDSAPDDTTPSADATATTVTVGSDD